MTDNHPHGADDLAAALDFSVPDEASTGSDRDARDEQVFTAANPDRSVTVTALSDSRVKHIELSPKVAAMTEAVLAEEIVVVAGLAAQRPRPHSTSTSSKKCARVAMMTRPRETLTRDLELPTPQQVRAERERIFATRYAGGHG